MAREWNRQHRQRAKARERNVRRRLERGERAMRERANWWRQEALRDDQVPRLDVAHEAAGIGWREAKVDRARDAAHGERLERRQRLSHVVVGLDHDQGVLSRSAPHANKVDHIAESTRAVRAA